MSGRKRAPRCEASSGNVFADLGFEHPEAELLKAQLVYQIGRLIAARQLKQVQAARLLGIPQPKASMLLRGTTAGFSTDRLIRCLNRLDQDVEIIVRQKPASRPKAWVRVGRQPGLQAPSREGASSHAHAPTGRGRGGVKAKATRSRDHPARARIRGLTGASQTEQIW